MATCERCGHFENDEHTQFCQWCAIEGCMDCVPDGECLDCIDEDEFDGPAFDDDDDPADPLPQWMNQGER